MKIQKTDILMFVAPSGSGKDYLKDYLLALFPHLFIDAISTTTRDPRVGEKHGVNYFYEEESSFLQMLADNKFIESVNFNGNYYAVSQAEVEKGIKLGKTTILVVEPNGLVQILDYSKDLYNVKVVFLDIPEEIVIQNMKERGDTDEMITKRLQDDNIREEMNQLIDTGVVSPDLIVYDLLPIQLLAHKVLSLMFDKQAIIFSGPSGTGKSTLETAVVDNGFKILKSFTTRSKRPGEDDSVYHFTDIHDFNQRDLFNIIHISETWKYGTSVDDINSDKLVFSVIDVEPALTLRQKLIDLGYYVCLVALDKEPELTIEERRKNIEDRNESDEDAKLRFEREKNITIFEQFKNKNVTPSFSFKGLGKTKTEYVDFIFS